jgi:hypothetical protein
MTIMNLKSLWINTIAITIMGLMPVVIYAESVRFVHWWDEYLPHHGKTLPGWYQGNRSIQYQDVNGDGIYNDALIWHGFSLTEPLNPPSETETGKKFHRYRVDYPSARFYGGLMARFTNVSHITEKDKKGKKIPVFDHIQQSTVQPTEGARPCSYFTKSPHNTGRTWTDEAGKEWADMTVMVVNDGGKCCPISDKFQKQKDAEVNFTAVFLWKKEDFINGGAMVKQITFDETSKISVNVTRFRRNIEEGRFVVQDGSELWISEATAIAQVIDDEEEHLSLGIKGMNVENFNRGGLLELNPLNSRWAIYTPLPDQEQVDNLQKALEGMEFKPKKATDAETQSYQKQSDELLEQVNKIDFNSKTATFVEHTFEDVQAVGVYFATYQFAHKTTMLVFDNFQAYAAGTIPKAKAVALKQGQPVNTQTSVSGGISVNCGPYKQIVRQCVPDLVKIQGNLSVESADVGKQADIVAVARHKPDPEYSDEPETFYMLGNEGQVIAQWDGNLDNLIAFQEDLSLEAEQAIQIFQGKVPLTGTLQIFFGYRLQDGTVVYNPRSIEAFIYPENTSSRNEMPYSESIKGLCPTEN